MYVCVYIIFVYMRCAIFFNVRSRRLLAGTAVGVSWGSDLPYGDLQVEFSLSVSNRDGRQRAVQVVLVERAPVTAGVWTCTLESIASDTNANHRPHVPGFGMVTSLKDSFGFISVCGRMSHV